MRRQQFSAGVVSLGASLDVGSLCTCTPAEGVWLFPYQRGVQKYDVISIRIDMERRQATPWRNVILCEGVSSRTRNSRG